MKKLIELVIAVVLVLGTTACGGMNMPPTDGIGHAGEALTRVPVRHTIRAVLLTPCVIHGVGHPLPSNEPNTLLYATLWSEGCSEPPVLTYIDVGMGTPSEQNLPTATLNGEPMQPDRWSGSPSWGEETTHWQGSLTVPSSGVDLKVVCTNCGAGTPPVQTAIGLIYYGSTPWMNGGAHGRSADGFGGSWPQAVQIFR